jgi:tetratricopeptide (TPR) repeat protein
MDFGMGKHYVMPVVEMASRTRTLTLGKNAAGVDPQDNKEWMRWNNYGIAMLDAQQYAESVAAFERVAQMRPDYADAFTNIAIANFQWQRYDVSRTNLNKALELSPQDSRALYYLALVERNQGQLENAIADLREVTSKYPRSRDAHRELGFSLYQQHKYDEARVEYESLQSIDPDDLAAHYILSIVYRRLGMKEKAAHEAAMFADQKDDPMASTFALEYLRRHSELAAESVPWHTHSDAGRTPAGGDAAHTR